MEKCESRTVGKYDDTMGQLCDASGFNLNLFVSSRSSSGAATRCCYDGNLLLYAGDDLNAQNASYSSSVHVGTSVT